ncbi:hypothetical protein BM221_004593 [Beauveria bassiana]|uniref:Uncharacterized protein n=1 Tax=Beauveria bassiana TaxID=176275 RepID=A0A2N6NRR5_BEABA|nr:hypothetical protein BM221_004593 [Beauveria bassiana]
MYALLRKWTLLRVRQRQQKSSRSKAKASCQANSDPENPTYDQEDAQPASIEVEDEPSWATREMQAADEPPSLTVDDDSEGEVGHNGNNDRGSSPDGSPTPDPLQWKSGLECIFFEDDSIADV